MSAWLCRAPTLNEAFLGRQPKCLVCFSIMCVHAYRIDMGIARKIGVCFGKEKANVYAFGKVPKCFGDATMVAESMLLRALVSGKFTDKKTKGRVAVSIRRTQPHHQNCLKLLP